jgi:hypothetical protein
VWAKDPTPAFAATTLDLAVIGPGDIFGRIYRQAFPDPLGYGKGRSRFSDPRRLVNANRFGVLYLGSSLKVCFLEAILRDERDGVVGDYLMAESELDTRNYAEIRPAADLKLIDLTGDGPIRMGIPSDVAGASSQALARRWSLAIYQHPEQVDGILYPSRLNGETNLALYDRGVPNLARGSAVTLRRAVGLAQVLNDFRVGLV